MGNHFGYTILGPRPDTIDLPIRLSKSPTVRREPKLSGNNLRKLYQNPTSPSRLRSSLSSTENGMHNSTTPVLPPTPPNVEDGSHGSVDEPLSTSEVAKARSILVTPVNQISPPTPDYTPPREASRTRHYLGAQPSMTSTRAESFKTAHEDLSSDKEFITSSQDFDYERGRPLLLSGLPANGVHRPSPLAGMPITNGGSASRESSPPAPLSDTTLSVEAAARSGIDPWTDKSLSATAQDLGTLDHSGAPVQIRELAMTESVRYHPVESRGEVAQRSRSLRERLEHSRHVQHSPSVDKFASIIGWSNGVQYSENDQRRWSAASNTSTVEAFLIEQPRSLPKRNTLRHVSKNESLRSVSSPLPISNRTSLQSSSTSTHRLVHKKAKLTNQNRLSFGSEASTSIGQNVHLSTKEKEKEKEKELEIIKVAVIPQRSSSLQQLNSNSRRHSFSATGAPTSYRMPRNLEISQSRQRANTDTLSADRGRDHYHPPLVPLRSSSLSAPTSRNTSRANSVTSDHAHVERKRAEKDLRLTLDRMESERLVSSLKSISTEHHPSETALEISGPDQFQTLAAEPGLLQDLMSPGSTAWAELRPSSTLHTPFSQPSFISASPEISEARLISLHQHNNHSIQLIEPFLTQESHAVEETRKLNQTTLLNSEKIDLPSSRPQNPPAQVEVLFTPVTPRNVSRDPSKTDATPSIRPTTPTRPAVKPRMDSFAKTLLRNVSLKHARNKKASQDLDSTQNPFWRPQPFWKDIEGGSPEKQGFGDSAERGLVKNSLGLPQQRIVVAGPLALVRKFSERRQNRKTIVRQSSCNSLQRLRVGRKLHRFSGLRFPVHIGSFREIQHRMVVARQRREDEQRERRREVLRKSIGANIIATGDSRFPSSVPGDNWPLA